MQDYDASDESEALDAEDRPSSSAAFKIEGILKSMFKRLVTFVCFGPGVLGVLWVLGRIFKR